MRSLLLLVSLLSFGISILFFRAISPGVVVIVIVVVVVSTNSLGLVDITGRDSKLTLSSADRDEDIGLFAYELKN